MAKKNDQTIRAKLLEAQADGLDQWIRTLEAHEPDISTKSIVRLRAAAKTLRELASEDTATQDNTEPDFVLEEEELADIMFPENNDHPKS